MAQTLKQWWAAQLQGQGPLALDLDRDFQLCEQLGDEQAFGLELQLQADVRDALPVLYACAGDEPMELASVGLPGGAVVDLRLQPHGQGMYLLLRDASRRHDEVQASQQQRNETELLRRQLAQALAEAEQANQAKSRFMAAMSHEFRTPLTSILGYARRLQEQREDKPGEAAAAITRGADYLLSLVNNLIDQGRLDADELVIQEAPCALAELVAMLREIFTPLCAEKGLALRVDCDPQLPDKLQLDGSRLRQIAVNLLGNACKFTAEGEVGLTLSWRHGELLLQVRDSGPGIAPEQQARIFEPFARVDEQAPGAGLGLAISRQIAQRMGGELSLQSQPGEGATFRLRLPAAQVDEPAAPAVVARSLRIVLVEDDIMIARLLSLYLEEAGHQVKHCEDGQQALQWLDTHATDCLITDMNLPGMRGPELIRELRSRGKDFRIITLSGSLSSSDRKAALDAGSDLYESKPIAPEHLLAIVAAADERN